MANETNLKPWKKGQSGNPKGKPTGTLHVSHWIRKILDDDKFEYTLSNGAIVTGPPIKAIINALVIKSLEGDVKAFELLARYGYGAAVNDLAEDNQVLIQVITRNRPGDAG